MGRVVIALVNLMEAKIWRFRYRFAGRQNDLAGCIDDRTCRCRILVVMMLENLWQKERTVIYPRNIGHSEVHWFQIVPD